MTDALTGSVTVMTLNAGNGIAPDADLVSGLRGNPVDVVGIQELNARQAGILDRTIAAEYPYRRFFGDSFEGRGILSRHPIRASGSLELAMGRPDC